MSHSIDIKRYGMIVRISGPKSDGSIFQVSINLPLNEVDEVAMELLRCIHGPLGAMAIAEEATRERDSTAV